jgi:DNA polymerase-3 subunit beta
MKLTIEREQLLPALQVVNGVVERRQTLPILSNLLLRVGAKSLTLTATDMEVELVVEIERACRTVGEVTLPARKLLDICRALPENVELTLDLDGDRAVVMAGKNRFTLATLPAAEYPLIELGERVAEVSLPQKLLKGLLDRTAFAMAQQDVRYYLNGLLLEIGQGRVRAVATDGHRLALCDEEAGTEKTAPVQIIVPRKGILELVRLLDEKGEDALIQVTRNHIRVNLGHLTFTSKLIDGKFPDYTKVIPTEGGTPVVGNREELRQGFIRASILSNEKYRGVRVSLERNLLRALAHNPEQEEAEVEIEVNYGGPNLEIGFNVSYLLDALGIIRTDQVRMTVTDPGASALIVPDGESACRYVVMPMRL